MCCTAGAHELSRAESLCNVVKEERQCYHVQKAKLHLVVDVRVCLPPSKIILQDLICGVANCTAIKIWRALQRLRRKVLRPPSHIVPSEA